MTEADLEGLRATGLADPAIHDAIQVIAYFNYINRLADAVHVDLEDGMPAYP
jgi:alkylhydroperoxidase family enzyme